MVCMLGATGVTLDYVIRSDSAVPPEATDPADKYLMVDQEMTYRAWHKGTAFRNDKLTVCDIMSNIYGQHECWIYIKPAQHSKDGRIAYELLFDHYIGPNNVGNMVSAETKLTITMYNGEKKIFTW
jgi:hypothetical protein